MAISISKPLKSAFSFIARIACEELTRGMKPRIIMDREGGSVYLERYYLFGGPGASGNWPDEPMSIYLHHFRRSDDDEELHNHPWESAVSFILAGGYVEERRIESDQVVPMLYEPFDFNVVKANDFHRVDLIENDCWSIFIAGKKLQSWGFWNRATKTFLPWREFIAGKRGISVTEVEKDS